MCSLFAKVPVCRYQNVNMCGSRGGEAGGPPPENHKFKGFTSNIGPDPQENYKATKPAVNVGPLSARQRNAIYMAFCCRADDGPLIEVFGSSLPSQKKDKSVVKVGPPLTKFSGSAHGKG